MRAPRGQSERAEFSLYHTLCTFVKLNVAQIFNLNDPDFCVILPVDKTSVACYSIYRVKGSQTTGGNEHEDISGSSKWSSIL